MTQLQIGISIGDPNGIGPEVVIKALSREGILELVTPVIYASEAILKSYRGGAAEGFRYEVISSAEQAVDGKVNLITVIAEDLQLKPGEADAGGGRAAARSLEAAVNDLKEGNIDALVTAPINKSVMPADDFPYPGHTEMLTEKLGAEESLMFLVTDELRVGVVTNHIPVSEIAGAVTKEAILQKLKIMDTALRSDFGQDRPVIAVLGLNPHASDQGKIGKEDVTIVRPAVEAAKAAGILAMGPFPADGFFGTGKQHDFDGVLAMYHDQGLIPFKTLSFGKGVNYTAGLPAIRTSPDHGTAYDLVGQDVASPESFIAALFRAHEAVQHRERYDEDTANPLGSYTHLVYKKRPRGEKGAGANRRGGKPGGRRPEKGKS